MKSTSLCRLLICILTVCLLLTTVLAEELLPEGYRELYPVETTVEAPQLFSAVESALEGKSILFFGDSLLASYGLADYSASWTVRLKNEYGMKIKTDARSGSTIATADKQERVPGGSYQPFCLREVPPGTYDIIFVAGGGNDWYCEIPLGKDYSSRDTKTFIGAINTVIDNMQETCPDALLLFSTSWTCDDRKNGLGLTPDDYNEVLMEVCSRRGVPCFEACDAEVTGIVPGNGMFIAENDIWHLNEQGHAHYLPIIAAWIESQLAEDGGGAEEPDYVVPFTDVAKDAWYAQAVSYAQEKGLMNGTGETVFSPDTDTNRAMLVTILYRASGSPSVEGLTHPFVDGEEGQYYSDALLWAYNNEIVNGISEDHFAPEGVLTREQLATILHRMAGLPAAEADLSSFPDAGKISAFAGDAMTWAVEQGILQGDNAGNLMPVGNASRAQIATILMRYLNQYPLTA